MKIKNCIILFLLFSLGINAQTEEQRKKISANYSGKEFRQGTQELNTYIREQQEKVKQLIASGRAERYITNENGDTGELVGVNRNNEPIYYFVDNADAATSTRTIFLYENGGLDLDLRGEDMIVGVWDQQMAFKDHLEFIDDEGESRVEMLDGFEGNHSFHATHVTGTIAASGVNPAAKGMATSVTVHSYNWGNDMSQLQNEAADGLLISNHSYGQPVENTSSTDIGKYNQQSRAWDLLTQNFTYLLPVISAGNDGTTPNSNPMTSGFDKLIGNKVSKNTLVIANVNDVTLMNNGSGDIAFAPNINPGSSQGPSDDGRVKPDVAGNGQNVFSTGNSNIGSYSSATGTSMSAPNVAGTLILLQELYNDERGEFMLASTLRGLVSHTATDAGDVGPDPRFGWGVVDAKFAAETILKSNPDAATEVVEAIIIEHELQEGETYTFTVKAKGEGKLKASATWTDRRGDANTGGANDDTPVLVHDLDLRVYHEDDGDEFLPWKLNLDNLYGGAIKGDNIVDNIEVVEVDDNDNDYYTIEVSHKGDLVGGSQMVSIIVTGLENNLSTNEVQENELAVWPNPTSNILNISLQQAPSDASYEIYDITGRRVQAGKLGNSQNQEIEMSSLKTGNYILKINTKEGVYREKIIKK